MNHYIITNFSLAVKADQRCEYDTTSAPENKLLKLLHYDTVSRTTHFLDELVVTENVDDLPAYRNKCRSFVEKSSSYEAFVEQLNTKRTLFFVHGVNCPPKRFEYFIRKLEKKYMSVQQEPAIESIVLIVWHSLGKYRPGRRRAVHAAKLFATWFSNLREVLISGDNHFLMCQSSGNYFLQHLQYVWKGFEKKSMLPFRPRKVFFLAADIDFDLYQSYTDEQVKKLADQFEIIYNPSDIILDYGYHRFHPGHRLRMGLNGAKSSLTCINSSNIYDDIKDALGIAAIDDYDEDDRVFIEDLEKEYPITGFTGVELHLSHFYFIWSNKIVSLIRMKM